MKRNRLQGIWIAALALLTMAQPVYAVSFAYVVNSGPGAGGSTITAFRLDKATGALTPLSTSPFAAGADVNGITLDISEKFLFVTNENDNTVGAYRINAKTGALTPIAGSPFASGTAPNCPRTGSDGRFLYVPNENSHDVFVYRINQKTGALTPIAGSPFAADTAITDSIALDRKGRFAYVSDNRSPGHVLAFRVNKTTGALSPITGSPFLAGAFTDTVAVEPQGRFVFAGNFGDQTVSVFAINQKTGALTPVAGSPFAVGGAPDEITVDRKGDFLYTANDGNIGPAGIGAFRINRTTGALTALAGTPFTAGNEPSGVTVHPANDFLFAANESSNNVSVFSINKKTGELTQVAGSPFTAGTEPVKTAIRK